MQISYNGFMNLVNEYSMIVGFNRGRAAILKMPWNDPNADTVAELSDDERIWLLIHLIRPDLYIEHFDVAARVELKESIVEILEKHRPSGEVINASGHSKIRELWDHPK